MKKITLHFGLLFLFTGLLGGLHAQMSPSEALAMRADMTKAVLEGSESAASAIARLAKAKGVSGLNIEAGAELAFACMDIGQRLLIQNHGADAAQFFKAAEAALAILVRTTPDAKAAQKARYLQQIAFVRGHCLGQTGQSKLDIDQAISLQPDDKDLQRIKRWIGNAHGSVFKEGPADSPKGK